MNSLLYYYNNVQKMAAYWQAKRMQRGVLTAQGGFSTTDPDLLHVPCTIQCVFVPQTFESRQCVFDTRGSSASPRIDILENGRMSIYYSGSDKTIDISIGTLYNITFVTTETEQSVYVGGELLGSAPYSTPQFAYYVIGALTNRFMYRFKGDYLLHRRFNYAMSADEVKALDNNGDPMGYVVPKAMRGLEPVEITGSNSYTWTGVDSVANVGIRTNPNIEYGKFYVVNISVSDYEAGSPYLYIGYSYGIPKVNGNYNILIEHQHQSSNTILLFGGPEGTDRRLTLTVNSVTPVGLLAEYLPQNLMFGRDDKAIATSWLDSAKQLPLSDEYMEPLFQSIGGYDMIANGAPEILYNE